MRGDTGRVASVLESVGKAPIPALGLTSLLFNLLDLAPLVITRAFPLFWVKPEALNAEASLEIPGLFNARLGKAIGASRVDRSIF